MECLKNKTIQEYIDKSLNRYEQSIIRDHLIVCEKCRAKYEQFKKMEKLLINPVYKEPPAKIEKFVMNRLFSKIPTYSSIFVLISLSFVLLVSWVYIYFDFDNNSIIQAFKLTSNSYFNWITSIITFISNIFSSVYAIFKVLNKLFMIIFNVNIGTQLFGLIILSIFISVFYFVSRIVYKKLKEHN